MRIDRVLRDQGQIIAKRLGCEDQISIAFPGGIIGLFRILMRRTRPMHQRPNAEAKRCTDKEHYFKSIVV